LHDWRGHIGDTEVGDFERGVKIRKAHPGLPGGEGDLFTSLAFRSFFELSNYLEIVRFIYILLGQALYTKQTTTIFRRL
jgi:hypothetical protein